MKYPWIDSIVHDHVLSQRITLIIPLNTANNDSYVNEQSKLWFKSEGALDLQQPSFFYMSLENF